MDRAAIVVESAAIYSAEHEHRSQRREPDLHRTSPKEKLRCHFGGRFGAGSDSKPVRARDRVAVEQGVDDESVVTGTGLLDPESTKSRELLAAHFARVDRQPARGQAIDLVASNGSEIAGAEKHQELLMCFGRVDGIACPEPCETHSFGVLGPQLGFPVFEQIRREGELHGLAIRDQRNRDRVLVEEAWMEQIEPEIGRRVRPYRRLRIEPDRPILIVAEVLVEAWKRIRRRLIGDGRKPLRLGHDLVEREVRGCGILRLLLREGLA